MSRAKMDRAGMDRARRGGPEAEARALAVSMTTRLRAAGAHGGVGAFDLRDLEDPTVPAAVVLSVAYEVVGRVFSTRRAAILAIEDWWVARLRREAHERAAASSLAKGERAAASSLGHEERASAPGDGAAGARAGRRSP